MKNLRFLLTADWHLDSDPKKVKKAQQSLDQIVEYCTKTKIDAIVHSGDFWDRKQSYSENSGVPFGIDYLRKLAKLVDFIFITSGNASHDSPGSISLLHQLENNVFAYEYPVCLGIDNFGGVTDLLREQPKDSNINYTVSIMPYPVKSMMVRDMSIDDNNREFGEIFDGLMDLFGITNEKYNCPKVFSFHGNVRGSQLSTGQQLVGQDIIIPPISLRKAKADVYSFGHIHLRQEFASNMFYTGSLYNKNFGETEQKSFTVSEFVFDDDGNYSVSSEQIMLIAARPMINVTAEFINGEFVIDQEVPENAEVKIKYKIEEDLQDQVTAAKKEELKARFGADTILEADIIPVQRESRSVKIMEAKNLTEEFTEYCTITGRDEVFKTNGEERMLKSSYQKKIELIEQNIVPVDEMEEL